MYIYSVNCGPLLSIPNSQILPYASTVEGAKATIMCQNVIIENDYIVAVCNHEGKWEMNATADVCTNSVVNVSGKYFLENSNCDDCHGDIVFQIFLHVHPQQYQIII